MFRYVDVMLKLTYTLSAIKRVPEGQKQIELKPDCRSIDMDTGSNFGVDALLELCLIMLVLNGLWRLTR